MREWKCGGVEDGALKWGIAGGGRTVSEVVYVPATAGSDAGVGMGWKYCTEVGSSVR